MRQFVISLASVISGVALCVTTRAAAPQTPAELSAVAGTWVGKVATDAGEMKITVVIKVEKGKVSGSIENAHGSWPIKEGTLKDGTWTLPFEVEGEAGPWMKGKVKGDTFTGQWNNAPMAVGTFELARRPTGRGQSSRLSRIP